MTTTFVRSPDGTPHPFNDAYTLDHFERWLDRSVHEDERVKVREQVTALLSDAPYLVDVHGWPTLRVYAENR